MIDPDFSFLETICADALATDEIIRQAKRYYPIFPDGFELDVGTDNIAGWKLPFYDDYDLVRLQLGKHSENGREAQDLYGLYAPGDFRIIDANGKTIEKINRIGPIHLLNPDSGLPNTENAIAYFLFRLALLLYGKRVGDKLTFCRYSLHPKVDMRKMLNPKTGIVKAQQVDVDQIVFRGAQQLVRHSDSGTCETAHVHFSVGLDGELVLFESEARWAFNAGLNTSKFSLPIWAALIRRARACAGVTDLNMVAGAQRDELMKALAAYKISDNNDLILRSGGLPFYRTTNFLELLVPEDFGYRPYYALYRHEDDGIKIIPLNGVAEIGHTVNPETALADETAELSISVDLALSYLRYFLWARKGQDGNFRILDNAREITVDAPLPLDVRRALSEICPQSISIEEVKQRGLLKDTLDEVRCADAMLYFDCCIVYSDSIFKSVIDVNINSGQSSIVTSALIAENVKIVPDDYCRHEYAALAQKPDNENTISIGCAESLENQSDEWSVEQFENIWRETSRPQNGIVKNICVIDDPSFDGQIGKVGRELIFQNCVFEEEFLLMRIGAVESIKFENCKFLKGFKASGFDFSGDLVISNCEILTNTEIALDLSTASLRSLRIERTAFLGSICAPRLKVSGSIWIRGISLGRPMSSSINEEDQIQTLEIAKRGLTIPKIVDEQPLANWERTSNSALDFYKADIGGDVFISSSYSDGNEIASRIAGNIELRCEIKGTLILHGLACHGRIVLSGALLHGGLQATNHFALPANSEVKTVSVFHNISAAGAKIGDEVSLSGVKVFEDVSLWHAEIEGWCFAEQLTVLGGVDFLQAKFAKGIQFKDFYIAENFRLDLAEINGLARFDASEAVQNKIPRAIIAKKFSVIGAKIDFLDFDGVSIGDELIISSSHFRRVQFNVGLQQTGLPNITPSVWVYPCSIGKLTLKTTIVDGDLSLGATRIYKGHQFKSRGVSVEERDAGIFVRECKIAGDLIASNERLSSIEIQNDLLEQYKLNRETASFVHPDLNGVGNGQGPGIGNERLEVMGNFDLQAIEIGGRLDLRNVAVGRSLLLNDAKVGLDVRMDASYRLLDRRVGGLKTEARFCDLEKIQCASDMNLAGLRITQVDGLDWTGDLQAQGANIKGVVNFVDVPFLCQSANDFDAEEDVQQEGIWKLIWGWVRKKIVRSDDAPEKKMRTGMQKLLSTPAAPSANGHPPYLARVEGNLDMSSVTANSIIITKDNVPDPEATVCLQRGAFGRFEIYEPTPAPIDLSGINVGRWKFGYGENDGSEDVNKFIEVLRNLDPFDLGVWTSVEQMLRNESRRADADEVYRKMKGAQTKNRLERLSETKSATIFDACLRNLRQWIARLNSAMFNLFLGYGTRPWRPLLLTFGFATALLVTFSDEKNVVPSQEMLDVIGGCVELKMMNGVDRADAEIACKSVDAMDVMPSEIGYQWDSMTDALAMTVRYSIPVVSIATHGRWAPSHTRKVSFFGIDVSVEQFAFIVMLYNWIAWPFFITFAANRILRTATQ